MMIRIKKSRDGTAALSMIRDDGTTTWQKQNSQLARFFPLHDLTHYAVETVLGVRRGFYGLVAEGWDISDFGTPWPRGKLPADSEPSELVVGFLDVERASGVRASAAEFNEKAAAYYEQHGIAGSFELTDDELTRIRARRAELFQLWDAVLEGDALELEWIEPVIPRESERGE
jgi:hypothetical protein